jgi:PAS domain S-box-containing protein
VDIPDPSRLANRPLHILLVGPKEEDFFLIRSLLGSHDRVSADLDHAPDVKEANRLLSGGPYDLVLFQHESGDRIMAGVLHTLRSQGRMMPFLILTEETDETALVELVRASASECVRREELGQPSFARSLRCAALLHRREEDFADSQSLLHKLMEAVEHSADMVIITDRSGAIEYVNPAFERTTGYDREEVVGKTPRILKSGEQGAEFYRQLWRTLLSGKVFRGVLTNRKKNGEAYIVEKTATALRDGKGEIVSFVSNDRDISQFRKMETALFQAHKMDAIGQLATGVAHDFNNLLMVVSSYAELLLDEIPETSPLRKRVEEIQYAGRRAADLTRQLLAFGQKQPQQLQLLDLGQKLHDLARILPRLIGEDVNLTIDTDSSVSKVRLDPVQIEQILMNLAANARDAMPAGGNLTFRVRDISLSDDMRPNLLLVPGKYVLLEVADTGAGIPREHLPHIFEPFYTTKEQGKGTGLGLATVYGIVKQSGGYVWVDSQEGKGTRFRIYFPAAQSATEAHPARRPEPGRFVRSGTETVLFVEDEPAIRAPASEFLAHCGYRVLTAANGREAQALLSETKEPVDLVVTDVVMPEMGGGELAEFVRGTYPRTRILFMSGYAENVILDHAVLDSANLLQKPFTLRALADRVREALDSSRSAPAAD